MTKYYCLIFLLCFAQFIFILINPPCASNNNVTELVDEVCAKTSNYSFCVESLYSDPHTPQSDQYGLADVAFSLAYLNATSTKDYIEMLLLENATSTLNRMQLQSCGHDYEEAVSAIASAIFDLNSDTFFELADLASDASRGAEDCQTAIKGTHYSQLDFINNGLKGLCEICVVVSNLFTGNLWDV